MSCDTFDIKSDFIKDNQMKMIKKIKSHINKSADNPKLKIEKIDISTHNKSLYVVQDGYLIAGTKQRVAKIFVKKILKENDKVTTLLYAGTSNGFGAVATAYSAYKLGLKSQVFLSGNTQQKNTRQINTLLALDSKITLCPTFKEARKIQYIVSDIKNNKEINDKNDKNKQNKQKKWSINPNFYNVPMGLNDANGIMTDLLSKQIKKASKNTIIDDVKYLRIWLVGGSGGIAQSIFKAFPNCKLFIFLTGHGRYRDEVIRWAKSFSKSKPNTINLIDEKSLITENNKNNVIKYYSTVKNYDDFIWPYVKKYGENGDFIWNVASDDYLYFD